MTTPAETASRFRGDIQGLRALAVLTVIAAHAGLDRLEGGFVGVDVFFVISGFLITQQLVGAAERAGNASLIGFYSRRARRILPAATVVLVGTVVASTLFLGFLQVRTIVVDAVWAAGFGANIRSARSGVDYFAADLPPSPVQHFWSLAVEEQFYLVWPLVVIGVVFLAGRWSRRGAAGHTERRGGAPVGALLAVILVLAAASLAWSVVATANSPTTAYFSTFTRAWELGLGAAAALVAHRVPGRLRALGRVRWLSELSAAAGVAAIAWACVRLDDATPYPGTIAAVPVVGTTVVLLVGTVASRPTWTARLLSLRPARIIGDWSYSLYLWHWPILIVAQEHLRRALTPTESLALVALTVVLAGLTYHLVETPFRVGVGWFGHRGGRGSTHRPDRWLRAWTRPPRALVLYPASLVLVVGSALAGNAVTDYREANRPDNPPVTLPDDWRSHAKDELGKQPAVALVRRSVRAAEHGVGVPSLLRPALEDVAESIGDVGECDYETGVRILCRRGDPDASKTLVVVGNSHGRHWISAFEEVARHAGYAAYYLVISGCTLALVTPDDAAGRPRDECVDFHTWAIDQVEQLDPELVVVSSTGTDGGLFLDDGTYVTDSREVTRAVGEGFADLFVQLGPHTDRLVLLDDIPRVHGTMSDCLASGPDDLGDCLSRPFADRAEQTRVVGEAADELGVERIDTYPWFCSRSKCPAVIGDTIPYRDTSHMTNEYALLLARPLGEALGIW